MAEEAAAIVLPANPTMCEVVDALSRERNGSLLLRVAKDAQEALVEVRLIETCNNETGARQVFNVSVGEYEGQQEAGHA